jgi:hypothetical protein
MIDGGSKHLWNPGKFTSDYTVQHLRRQPSSLSLLWELELSPSWEIVQQISVSAQWQCFHLLYFICSGIPAQKLHGHFSLPCVFCECHVPFLSFWNLTEYSEGRGYLMTSLGLKKIYRLLLWIPEHRISSDRTIVMTVTALEWTVTRHVQCNGRFQHRTSLITSLILHGSTIS